MAQGRDSFSGVYLLVKYNMFCYYENIIDNYAKKMNTPEAKAIVKKHGSIVEHPFGTIKGLDLTS